MRDEGIQNLSPSSDVKSKNNDGSFATLRIHGHLGKTSDGQKIQQDEISAPVTVGELLSNLSRSLGLELRRDSTLVLVNGVEANALQDLDTVIQAGDEVALVPMFHGGGGIISE